jgi:hypothetical protein
MVITSPEQYNSLLKRVEGEKCIITPIYRDLHYHIVENEVLCVGVSFENNEHFIVSVSHKDAPQFPIFSGGYTDDAIQIIAHQTHRNAPRIENNYTPYIRDTHNTFGSKTNVNDVIPITAWVDALTNYNTSILPLLQETPNEYMVELTSTLREIERSGMTIEREMLGEYFDKKTTRAFKGDVVYSQYNPFTITGRPSNRFGGINFSALNKTDGTRDMFVSRYPNGVLLQFDFEAYHLRLIAEHLGITLPQGSLHTELAKVYFKTSNITPELYEESKRRTFNILYGNNDNYTIPLFEKVIDFKRQFENKSSLVLPSGIEAEVSEPSASKLFNYYIQSLEMYKTLPKLRATLDYLKNTTGALTLYTYDSILIDVESLDEQFINDIINILEGDDKTFPVRTYIGKTYGTITQI